MSISSILIHWDERRRSHVAWLSLRRPRAWPTFGKTSYFDSWLFALWADCGWEEQIGFARPASPLSWGSSRVPRTSRLLAPSCGASAGPGSVRDTSPAALQATCLRGASLGFVPKSSFLIHKENCSRFHAFNATFGQATAAWQ